MRGERLQDQGRRKGTERRRDDHNSPARRGRVEDRLRVVRQSLAVVIGGKLHRHSAMTLFDKAVTTRCQYQARPSSARNKNEIHGGSLPYTPILAAR